MELIVDPLMVTYEPQSYQNRHVAKMKKIAAEKSLRDCLVFFSFRSAGKVPKYPLPLRLRTRMGGVCTGPISYVFPIFILFSSLDFCAREVTDVSFADKIIPPICASRGQFFTQAHPYPQGTQSYNVLVARRQGGGESEGHSDSVFVAHRGEESMRKRRDEYPIHSGDCVFVEQDLSAPCQSVFPWVSLLCRCSFGVSVFFVVKHFGRFLQTRGSPISIFCYQAVRAFFSKCSIFLRGVLTPLNNIGGPKQSKR